MLTIISNHKWLVAVILAAVLYIGFSAWSSFQYWFGGVVYEVKETVADKAANAALEAIAQQAEVIARANEQTKQAEKERDDEREKRIKLEGELTELKEQTQLARNDYQKTLSRKPVRVTRVADDDDSLRAKYEKAIEP